jgi:branched-subunit amino acid transport protein
MSTWEALAVIVGLFLITLLTRAFFLLPEREWPIPGWLSQGLRYAPLGALVAVVAPEVVLSQGEMVTTLADPRVLAAAGGAAWYFWRRGILGTIVTGMVILLTLRLGLGW